MHFGAQRLQALLVAHAEAVFFVDDDEAEILEARMGVQKAVGGDNDVNLACLDSRERLLGLACVAEA